MILCSWQSYGVAGNSELSSDTKKFLYNIDGGVGYCGCQASSNFSGNNVCIGKKKDKCSGFFQLQIDGDEYGKMVMMLVESHVGGGLFCPAVVVGTHATNLEDVYYKRVGSDDTNCVWLCHNGYAGSECKTVVSDYLSYNGACDNINTTGYGNLQYNTSSSDDIDMTDVVLHKYHPDCSERLGLKYRQHDIIFVIVGWLNGGTGAYVRPYVVQGARDETQNKNDVAMYPAVQSGNCDAGGTVIKEKLVCTVGYKLNANGNGCEPISDCNANGPSASEYCNGWNASDFDSTKHSLIKVPNSNTGCYQWRCTDGKSILDKAGGTECTWYVWSPQRGVNPENGTGVQCPSAMVFNANVYGDGVSVNYCEDTIRVSGDVLLYGNGNSSTTWDKQCWTKTNPEEYKKCVALGVK